MKKASINQSPKASDILPVMAEKPVITILGPGRFGGALALALRQAGYEIREIVTRPGACSRRRGRKLAKSVDARVATFPQARWDANLVWLCVPDREISRMAQELTPRAQWGGKFIFHSSGALTSDELDGLRKRGASVASVHPLMTFVRDAVSCLEGIPFGVEGDSAAVRLARRVVRDLQGKPFTLRKQEKVAYHAWGTFVSPLLLATLVTAEQVAGLAGFTAVDARKKMLPIVRQTLANYANLGPAAAFSGPIVRGDAGIVRQHLQCLKKNPEARQVYEALARSALRYLPARNRQKLREALGPATS